MRRIVQFSDPHLVGVGETLKDVDTFDALSALRRDRSKNASNK